MYNNMNHEYAPTLELPDDLADETVAQLVATLYEIARVLENHYAGQLHRHRFALDEQQQDLWPARHDDPPF
jgi:hypothetical protein